MNRCSLLLIAGSISCCLSAPLLAGEQLERVQVRAATRLDWTFAVFKQSAPNPSAQSLGSDYDSTRQTYELFVPERESPNGHPLLLFIPAEDDVKGWRYWSKLCAQHQVLCAVPHDVGRDKTVTRRLRAVLDVLDDIRQRYRVDPDRTYLCGFLEGAHVACELAFALPEYFGGVIAVGGAEPPPRELWLKRQMANRISVALVRSSRETKRRERFFSGVFSPLIKQSGTRTALVSYSGGPRRFPDVQVIAQSLRWLDADVARRRELADRFPSTRVGNEEVVSREQAAQQALVDAKKRLENEETAYAACLQLEGIGVRWPDLAVASASRRILEEQKSPWIDQQLKDREAAFLADEQAHDRVYAVIFQKYPRSRLIRPTGSRYPEEHIELAWDATAEPLRPTAEYDGAAKAQINRLGYRARLDQSGRVSMLSLCGTLVTAKQLKKLREQLKDLESLRALDLSSAVMRRGVLNQLSELTGLRAIDLSHTEISNGSLASLSSLVNLQTLFLVGTKVSSLRQLGSPRELHVLVAGQTKLDDESLSWLEEAVQLRRLSLFSTAVTDRGVAQLKSLSRLEFLNLSSTRVTDEACHELARFPSLKGVNLDGTDLSDAGLAELKQTKLQHLSLVGTKITDAGLAQLSQLTMLKTLDVTKTTVSNRGISDLRRNLPDTLMVWDGAKHDPIRAFRRQATTEIYLRSVEDLYRRKLAEYQRQYFGFCTRYAAEAASP